MLDYLFRVTAVVVFLEHDVGEVSQVIANLVAHVAEGLKTCVLGLLKLSVVDVDLSSEGVDQLVELDYLSYYGLNSFL